MKDTARFFLDIKIRPDGGIGSSIKPASSEDGESLSDWPSGGLVQTSYALMVEFFKAESYTMAISMLSQGMDLQSLDSEELAERVLQQFMRSTDIFLGRVCEETLESIKEASKLTEE